MPTPRILAIIAACSLILSLAVTARGQEPLNDEMQAEIDELKSRVDRFFRQLGGAANAAPDADGAIREIVGTGPLRDRTTDVERLIEQAQTLRDARYGAYTGHEAVSVRAVGSDLVFLRYLYKAEHYPVVWYFTFYRATTAGGFKGNWTLISLRFDTKIEALDR
jgi:hypothetical protein